MGLIPLEIPPGIVRGGTDLQSSGRWRDASLVRWHDGVMQPVGGWREKNDPTLVDMPVNLSGIMRAAHCWRDNSANNWISFASHDALWVLEGDGAPYDITPAGLTTGLESEAFVTGYGIGGYGEGVYGGPNPDLGVYTEATTWALDGWGEYLVGCSSADGKLYEWQLNTGTAAAVISGAPVDCLSLVTTDERFLFALGAGGNPRKVAWCDREDNTVWTPLATNEAGDKDLETSTEIMTGLRVRGQTLILTLTDAHAASYIGPPFVYGFERVGVSCGVISRKAAAGIDGGAIWMGQRGFFTYFGGAVDEIPSAVSDYVFSNLNVGQKSKIYAVQNSTFNEVWWFYPSIGATECDSYVAYNHREGHWMIGQMTRTCGVDRGVFRYPVWVGTDGIVYEHEAGYSNSDVFVESGPISLGVGDKTMHVTSLIPDERTQGEVSITFKTRFYPNAEEYSHGPYTLSDKTDVRFTGRQTRMRIEALPSKDFRWGIPRIEAKQRGGR